MKDEKSKERYEAVEVSSVVDISPSEFAPDNAISGMSPRRDRKAHHREGTGGATGHQRRIPVADIDLNPYHDDEAFDNENDLYDSEGKPRAMNHGDTAADARFRVNGIAIDREIQGGPKPNWEHSYQILFQSTTPTGQRVALILLIMVSLSIACGAFVVFGYMPCVNVVTKLRYVMCVRSNDQPCWTASKPSGSNRIPFQ